GRGSLRGADLGLLVRDRQHADRREEERRRRAHAQHVDRDVANRIARKHARADAPARERAQVRLHRLLGARAAGDVAEGTAVEFLLRGALPVRRGDRPLGRLLRDVDRVLDQRPAEAHRAILSSGMETTRLETFSDGVFAIAATLLILEIRLPGGGSLTHQLLNLWPSYAAYAVSFITIGIMWINHHAVFHQIERVDRTFLTINVISRAFLPGVPLYATAMFAALLSSWLSVALYAGISAFYVVESSLFGRS